MAKQVLTPHIDHAISPMPHPPMYLMHKFWARKPHNVVSEYIKHYSKPSEIVLDPFCGSGVTAIEALKLKRKTVAIDLDPIAVMITRMTLIPIDLEKYQQAFKQLEENVKDKINELYETPCPSCGKKAVVICYRWREEKLFEIRNLVCFNCGKQGGKKLSEDDVDKLDSVENMEIPYWYPKEDRLYYPDERPFKKKEKCNYIHELFTKRNLIALSILFNEINKMEDGSVKELMKFTFSSMVVQASKMMLWSKTSRPSWKVHSYWVPPERVELNVWDRFENRFQKILDGKTRSNEMIGSQCKEARSFDELLDDKTVLVATQSALNLKNQPAVIPDNSIDYVFTDPPYGGSVQYFELSALWASWLRGQENDQRFFLDFPEELTINESGQGKGFDYYHKMLRVAFEEIYRVLKPSRWLTVTFHNTSIKIYNSIIKAIVLAGFDLEKVLYQPPAKKGAKQQLQPYGSAVGDYYIRFRKPESRSTSLAVPEIDKVRYERIVVDVVKHIIAERGEPTPYSVIVNSYPTIYEELKRNGYLFSAPEDIEQILKRHVNKEFVLVDIKDEKGEILGKKWWLKDVLFLDRAPLDERVEKAVINELNRRHTVSFDEVLEAIFTTFQNALTPDTQSIKAVLEKYAEKTKDGRWRLKPSIKLREQEHDQMVESLAVIGEKAGFNVHADVSGWRKDTFPNIPKEKVKDVKEIDVIWFTKTDITHEFEVENTTGGQSAIMRGSNIPNGKVKRFIVIPEERQETLYGKINVPALKERVQTENWRFIFYDELKTFFHSIKRKQKISLEEFEKIAKTPQAPKKTIETLDVFNSRLNRSSS